MDLGKTPVRFSLITRLAAQIVGRAAFAADDYLPAPFSFVGVKHGDCTFTLWGYFMGTCPNCQDAERFHDALMQKKSKKPSILFHKKEKMRCFYAKNELPPQKFPGKAENAPLSDSIRERKAKNGKKLCLTIIFK